MPVFRRLGKELASALGMGLSFSVLVFESESLNRGDREIAEGCQLSLTTLILHILQLGGIGIASFIPQVYSQAFLLNATFQAEGGIQIMFLSCDKQRKKNN